MGTLKALLQKQTEHNRAVESAKVAANLAKQAKEKRENADPDIKKKARQGVKKAVRSLVKVQADLTAAEKQQADAEGSVASVLPTMKKAGASALRTGEEVKIAADRLKQAKALVNQLTKEAKARGGDLAQHTNKAKLEIEKNNRVKLKKKLLQEKKDVVDSADNTRAALLKALVTGKSKQKSGEQAKAQLASLDAVKKSIGAQEKKVVVKDKEAADKAKGEEIKLNIAADADEKANIKAVEIKNENAKLLVLRKAEFESRLAAKATPPKTEAAAGKLKQDKAAAKEKQDAVRLKITKLGLEQKALIEAAGKLQGQNETQTKAAAEVQQQRQDQEKLEAIKQAHDASKKADKDGLALELQKYALEVQSTLSGVKKKPTPEAALKVNQTKAEVKKEQEKRVPSDPKQVAKQEKAKALLIENLKAEGRLAAAELKRNEQKLLKSKKVQADDEDIKKKAAGQDKQSQQKAKNKKDTKQEIADRRASKTPATDQVVAAEKKAAVKVLKVAVKKEKAKEEPLAGKKDSAAAEKKEAAVKKEKAKEEPLAGKKDSAAEKKEPAQDTKKQSTTEQKAVAAEKKKEVKATKESPAEKKTEPSAEEKKEQEKDKKQEAAQASAEEKKEAQKNIAVEKGKQDALNDQATALKVKQEALANKVGQLEGKSKAEVNGEKATQQENQAKEKLMMIEKQQKEATAKEGKGSALAQTLKKEAADTKKEVKADKEAVLLKKAPEITVQQNLTVASEKKDGAAKPEKKDGAAKPEKKDGAAKSEKKDGAAKSE